MADQSNGLPEDLKKLYVKFQGVIEGIFSDFQDGVISLDEWRAQMTTALARHVQAAYMLGSKKGTLAQTELTKMARLLTSQLEYLEGFAGAIDEMIGQARTMGYSDDWRRFDKIPWKAWKNRAEMYTGAVLSPYWQGVQGDLPLPAVPGDGSSQCLQWCRCAWRIVPLPGDDMSKPEGAEGNYDCYWVLDDKAENCQTCLERSERWNPLQVRGWELVLPDYRISTHEIHSLKEAILSSMKWDKSDLSNLSVTDKMDKKDKMILSNLSIKGGPGSGNFSHAGRPGKVGGSLSVMGLRPIVASDTFDELLKNTTRPDYLSQSTAFWITKDGKLRTTRVLAGDHFEAMAYLVADDPGMFGFTKKEAKILIKAHLNLGERSWASEVISEGINKFKKSGATRVRVGVRNIEIESESFNSSTLRKLQRWFDDGKFGNPPADTRISWEGTDDNGENRWVSSINYADFMDSKYVVLGERGDKFSASLKGGKGSGNFSHAGRPGKRGGSRPRGMQTPQRITPKFKAWFRNSAAVNADGTPMVLFHGTTHDFQVFGANGESSMLDRNLGFHFAEDRDIANRFGMGLYGDKDGWGNYVMTGGNVMPVYLSIQNPKILKGYKGSDQAAIEREIVQTVYDQADEAQFLEWWSDRWSGTMAPEMGSRVYQKLKAGDDITKEDSGNVGAYSHADAADSRYNEPMPYGVGAYVASGGLGFGIKDKKGKEIADAYKKILKSQGYDGLVYENTSPMETGEITIRYHRNPDDWLDKAVEEKFQVSNNKRSWIAFYPSQIKSVFNQGNYDPKDPNIIKEFSPLFAQSFKGGPGSGNFGHHGRPGVVGGSKREYAPPLKKDRTDAERIERAGLSYVDNLAGIGDRSVWLGDGKFVHAENNRYHTPMYALVLLDKKPEGAKPKDYQWARGCLDNYLDESSKIEERSKKLLDAASIELMETGKQNERGPILKLILEASDKADNVEINTWVRRLKRGMASGKFNYLNFDHITIMGGGRSFEINKLFIDRLISLTDRGAESDMEWAPVFKGGPGSGNFQHAGRPGKRGGSAPAKIAQAAPSGSEAFNSWFGASQVVNPDGTPKTLYHGTPHAGFAEFRTDMTEDAKLAYGAGVYLTESPEAASGYAAPGASWGNEEGEETGRAVYPVYARIIKPFDLEAQYSEDEARRILGDDNEFLNDAINEDRDEDQINEWNNELDELFNQQSDLESADSHEDVSPDDYENGTDDEDYQKDVQDYIASDLKKVQRRITEIEKAMEPTPQNFSGRDIYKWLYKSDSDYWDAQRESSLIGGDTTFFQAKTNANNTLFDLGYDGLKHLDKYNPGGKGAHTVWIAFDPEQVKSVHNQGTYDPKDPNILKEFSLNFTQAFKGGKLSGNWGHRGRPGKVGGSQRDPQMKLPGMSLAHPNQQAKLTKIQEEEARIEGEREWTRVRHGYSERNSSRSSTLPEAEKELQNDPWEYPFGATINGEKSAGRTFLLETTGTKAVWYGEGFGSRALYLRDPQGRELLVGMGLEGTRVYLHHIFKNIKGGMLGVKFMRAMKRYSDLTGLEFRVVMVANTPYFRGFKWLKETADHDFIYKPEGKIELKGGPGSGNFSHAGRPGHRGGSAPSKLGLSDTAEMGRAYRRTGTDDLHPEHYTEYGTAEDARKALISRIDTVQPQINDLEAKIKDCNKRIAGKRAEVDKMAKEYKGISANSPEGQELRAKMDTVARELWAIKYKEKNPLDKQRKKLVVQSDKMIQDWVSGLQAKDPLEVKTETPQAQYFMEHIEKMLSVSTGGVEFTTEEKRKFIQDRISLEPYNQDDVEFATRVTAYIGEAGRLIDRSVLPSASVKIAGSYNMGAYYQPETDSVHIVNTYDDNYLAKSTFHEFGHWVEHHAPGASERMNEFVNRRTAGEVAKPISKQKPKILVRKDKFIDPYIGRDYKRESTEALSMGMELMLSDPLKFARKDPEHFNLVLSVLRGIPEK